MESEMCFGLGKTDNTCVSSYWFIEIGNSTEYTHWPRVAIYKVTGSENFIIYMEILSIDKRHKEYK